MKFKILEINNPLLLFNTADHKNTYIKFINKYHPDKHVDKQDWANEITAKVNSLYSNFKEINERVEKSRLSTVDLLFIRPRGVYTEYVYRNKIAFAFEDSKVLEITRKNIDKHTKFLFSFKNDKMKDEFKKCLPVFNLADNIVNVEKSAEDVPLELFLSYSGGKLNDRTVAWIVSRLLNFACYLQYNNLVYGSFTLKNTYINMEKHWLFWPGGWWNCIKEDDKFSMFDSEALSYIPKSIIKDGYGNKKVDLYIIKSLALKLLGNPMSPDKTTEIPKAFCNWLMAPPLNNAVEEFQNWDKVLTNSYDKRKFIPINVEPITVYNI